MTQNWYYNKIKNSDIVFWLDGANRDELTAKDGQYGCSKNNKYGYYSGYACGALIVSEGWEIPNDYPW